MRKDKNLLQAGLLLLRVGIGVSIFFHGLPKITGGPETWTAIGGTQNYGRPGDVDGHRRHHVEPGHKLCSHVLGIYGGLCRDNRRNIVCPGTVFPSGSPLAYRDHDCGAGYALFAGR